MGMSWSSCERSTDVQAVLDERDDVFGGCRGNLIARAGSRCGSSYGLSRTTIHAGIREFEGRKAKLWKRAQPQSGGGRKPLTFHHPDLLKALEQLVEPWFG